MAILCREWALMFGEIIDAAKTKPYGLAFYPGPGGHTTPARSFLFILEQGADYHTKLVRFGEINDSMPEFVVNNAMKL